MPKNNKPNKRGPESQAWDKHYKGQAVDIGLRGGDWLYGTVAWVDRYSIGLHELDNTESPATLIYKSAIQIVRAH